MRKNIPSSSIDLVPTHGNALAAKTPGGPLPVLVVKSGTSGARAWDDFFDGKLGTHTHTRIAYERAVRYFLSWADASVSDKSLGEISAGDVGRYQRGMSGGIQKKKQHLAGRRKFFNLLVERHLVFINPAAVAETERLQIVEGLTPIITDKQFRALLASRDLGTVVGLRDRAIFGVLAYTIVRGGAVGRLDCSPGENHIISGAAHAGLNLACRVC